MADLNWKIGFEIELMAPLGLNRRDLALAIAQKCGGSVSRFFHPQTEPSEVPGTPLFQNLTLGFEVTDSQGQVIARCVDDLTLQDDFDKTCPPQPGWYRILSDDTRLLQLIIQQADPAAEIAAVLQPIARLFGTQTETGSEGMIRVKDRTGAPIAIAAPLPGERERPCELITPPFHTRHRDRLGELLATARSLGFGVPAEGACHLHFDATPLCAAPVLANLVCLLVTHGGNLRRLVGTNPKCRRLGSWPPELWEMVSMPEFRQLPWPEASACLQQLELSKYCDFNLKNFIHSIPDKHTFEARIFPVWQQEQPILAAASLMEAILRRALAVEEIPPIPPLEWSLAQIEAFLNYLPMSPEVRQFWRREAQLRDLQSTENC